MADHRTARSKTWRTLQRDVLDSMRFVNHPLLSSCQHPEFLTPVGKSVNDSVEMMQLYNRKPVVKFYRDDGAGNDWGLYSNSQARHSRSSRAASHVGSSK